MTRHARHVRQGTAASARGRWPGRTGWRVAALCGLAMAPVPATAQTLVIADSGDTAWVMGAALVALLAVMPGLALMFLGDRPGDPATRKGGQTLLFAALMTALVWVVIGYSIAFAPGGPWVGSGVNAFLRNMGSIRGSATIEETAFALYQLVPALIATALVAGLLLRRASRGWLLGTILLWLLIVCLPLTRWSAAGWLATRGLEDFGGAVPMVLAAGVSTATAALIVRMRGDGLDAAAAGDDGGSIAASTPQPGLVTLARVAALGLVLTGWAALMGGAGLGAGPIAAGAILSTLVAAAAGAGAAWVAGGRRATADDGLSIIGRGMLGAFAAITAGAGLVGMIGAAVIGAMGAIMATHGTRILHRLTRDGTVAGALGTLALPAMLGLMMTVPMMAGAFGGSGLADGIGAGDQLVAQLVAIAVGTGWAVIGTLIAGLSVAVLRDPRRH